ncbi:MAG TPA: sulfotransferase domain-containing protein [Nocardioides sp.]|nr:sulfotransferase domain-containing protein [Nocardioides sp.]
MHPLPRFLIIGAQKAGTSTLYASLSTHPEIEEAEKKELHFFDRHYADGIESYRRKFPELERGQITGEATPYYLFHPLAPERVASTLPDVKLIAILRNPVERAYSQYHSEVRKGFEDLPTFEEAIAAETGRLSGEREKITADPAYDSYAWSHHSYLARGMYADQLERWFEHFSREQFLVLRSEVLAKRPGRLLRRCEEFLGISRGEAKRKRAGRRGHYEPMSEETRRRLEEFYEPHNRRLQVLLNKNFQW